MKAGPREFESDCETDSLSTETWPLGSFETTGKHKHNHCGGANNLLTQVGLVSCANQARAHLRRRQAQAQQQQTTIYLVEFNQIARSAPGLLRTRVSPRDLARRPLVHRKGDQVNWAPAVQRVSCCFFSITCELLIASGRGLRSRRCEAGDNHCLCWSSHELREPIDHMNTSGEKSRSWRRASS